jgi:undecaprenyl-diphosphatase
VSWPGFELPTLLLLGVIAGGLWGFFELADEVMEGETHRLDESLLLAMRTAGDAADPIGPGWLEEAGRDFTALGGVSVLTFITVMSCSYLLLAGKPHAALYLLVAVGVGVLISNGLKAGFERPRPELVPHGSIVHTASFPSGHSMLSAVTYLTLGALLARIQPRRRLKVFLLATAMLLALLVGASRVYLGVHWPTDVLAGWTAGAVWASLCWLAAIRLQQRGQVEADGEAEDHAAAG